MSDAKKCAAYARMARCDDPASMDAQVSMLMRLSEAEGFEVVKVHREVAPGCAGLDERPVLRELLEEIAAGAYDAVVVRDASRFARGDMHTAEVVLSTLWFSGTSVITPDGEYRSSCAEDMRMLRQCATTTDFEHGPVVDIRERLRRGASQGKRRNQPNERRRGKEVMRMEASAECK